MNITPETQVSEIVVHNPAATRVFHRYNIDFCCGGKRPLAEVCTERGLSMDQIRREIEATEPQEAEEKNWSEAPLAAIVEHILARYHAPLREELPRLAAMAAKVLSAHGERFPGMIPPVAARLSALKAELESHMVKEERVLFPFVVALEQAVTEGGPAPRPPFGSVEGPITVMEAEHEEAGRLLAEMRSLTRGYELPEGACNTFRALFYGLAQLEKEMHLHIHLENNVLFPRAAEMERRMAIHA
ncbi:MAG TPA: iron-sulfur cluster repair di-iron protein [Thermoanaerobaculia bacterium]|nr:iron-sulfur cluster repair di-iron protein [Thermoanaerobaculia bacterium]